MQPITGTHGIRQSRMRINIYGICIACVPLSLRSNLSFLPFFRVKSNGGPAPGSFPQAGKQP